ncbi:Purine catabolism regulatory protein [compost metagenome]
MNIKSLTQQVEQIIGNSIKVTEMDSSEWSALAEEEQAVLLPSGSLRLKDRFLWIWRRTAASVHVLEASIIGISDKEAALIDLLITAAREEHKSEQKSSSKRDDESRSLQLGEWILEQVERNELSAPVPESIQLKTKLQSSMLPFLLNCDQRTGQGISFVQLNKLLRSYFGGEIVLIPLREDWLIMVSESLMMDLREDNEEEAEHDVLGALCQGLYELISNEWGGGGYHVSTYEPIAGDNLLAAITVYLREIIQIGKLFNVSEHIHLPWNLQLERFVYCIPIQQRQRFIEESSKHDALFADEETLTTLDTFFQLDCNVSETAKRLYIHRNTLIYRIDKFKQETGLDVRTFEDAVLVKLKLLLYKVTKRA